MFLWDKIVRNAFISMVLLQSAEGFRILFPNIQSSATVKSPQSINAPAQSVTRSSLLQMSVQEPISQTINVFDQLLTEENAPLLFIPPPNSNIISSSSSEDYTRWCQAIKFIGNLQRAFIEKDSNLLLSTLSTQCKWSSPLVSDLQELKDELPKFMSFFGDPRLQIFNMTFSPIDNTLIISYQLSMWWPMPWRPRIIIPGTASVVFDGNTVKEVVSTWSTSPLQILTQQFPPRIWDMYSVFASPTPEYPPVQKLDFTYQKVKFLRLPQTVSHRVTWTAPAKFRGPPITVVPDFVLTGIVPNTARGESPANPLQATLPVDVQSSRFMYNEREFKMSTWRFHVPTALQSVLAEKIRYNWSQVDEGDTLLQLADNDADKGLPEKAQQEEREEETEAGSLSEDRVIVSGKENLSLLQSVKNGAMRGVLPTTVKSNMNFLSKEEMIDFEANQHVRRSLQVEPERIVAAVDIRGEIDANKINQALKMINQAVNAAPCNTRYRIKKQQQQQPAAMDDDALTSEIKSLFPNDCSSIRNVQSLFGLRLGATKMCFDHTGEPAMAVYELQYGWRLFTVTVDLEEI